MKKLVISALIACAAVPAAAQSPAPAAVEQVAPERLAISSRIAGKILPDGSYARMMNDTMEQMIDGAMSAMLDMDVGAITAMLTEEERAKVDPALLQMSMRELMEKCDPHFVERLSITNRTMWSELGPVMTRMEPRMREALAASLARRFDVATLSEIDRFFVTPAGAAFAAESVVMWTSPEMGAAMAESMPDMMEAMPSIFAKVQAATAHLPAEPKPEQMKQALLEIAGR